MATTSGRSAPGGSGAQGSSGADEDQAHEFPFAVATYLPHLVIVINRQRDLKINELLRHTGITGAQHRALSVIRRFQPCTMGDLADFNTSDRTTMTRTVDHLVEQGLLERRAAAADRRQVLLALTPLGRRTLTRSMALVRRFNEDVAGAVADQELRAAARVLERFAAEIVGDPTAAQRMLLRQPRSIR